MAKRWLVPPAAVVVAVAVWGRDASLLTEAVSLAVSVVAVVALASLSILAAARWIAKRHLARPGAWEIGCCLAIGVVAAIPVQAGWHDGCNGHGGQVALIEAPRTWLGSPRSLHTTYTDVQTLKLCIEQDIPEFEDILRRPNA